MSELVLADKQEVKTSHFTDKLSRLEVADGLYLLIVMAAAILRFFELGRVPLGTEEAREALAVWSFWQPGQMHVLPTSPAYFSLTGLATQLLGGSDAIMRLIPAIFGTAVVILPWFLRHRLGKVGGLILGLLLAVSPLGTVVSRTAGGEAIAFFALMLLLVAWIRLSDTEDRRWIKVGTVALGIGLASAPIFYGAFLSLGLAWLATTVVGPSLPSDEVSVPMRRRWRTPVLLGGLVFLALSTVLLWYPQGLGAAAMLPVTWLRHFNVQAGVARLVDPLLAAGRYEILLFVPGLAAIVWAAVRYDPLGTFCIYWLVGLMGLILLQQGQMEYALLMTVPGFLLLARFTSVLFEERMGGTAWIVAGVLWFLGLIIAVNLARYSRVMIYEPQKLTHIWIALFALTIALATLYFVGSWNVTAVYQGLMVGVLALLLYYQWGTGWWLGHTAANDPREQWVLEGTDDEVRILARVARDISLQTTRSEDGLEIFSTVDSPVLRWYLREFGRLEFGGVLPANADSAAIISMADSNIEPASDYAGGDFGLRLTAQPGSQSRGMSRLAESIRWWLFHQSSNTPTSERVVLWWRSDLVEAGD